MMPRFNLNWLFLGITLILIGLWFFGDGSSMSQKISWTKFQEYVEKGYVKDIKSYYNVNIIEATVKNEHIKDVFTNVQNMQLGKSPVINTKVGSQDIFNEFIKEQQEAGNFNGGIEYDAKEDYSGVFWSFFPFLLIFALWIFFMRRMSGSTGGGGGVFNVGKSRAQLFEKGGANKVTFKDVAGLEGAKQEVEEIVEFLKAPQKYTQLGGKIPKGALLVGPPGTGKTLLAKAVAGEANVPFFSLSGSDFVEMFVGVGASRVRDLFKQAKEKAPCIVFIDEIDAVGRARGKNAGFGGNDERENTLNQLLTEMDGFGSNSGVIILAATNRADILDKALLRAGRFSGADIANVCNEAALIAARHSKKSVGKQDFLDAVDRIVGGLEKKTKIMTKEEKQTIAIHEAGHATLSWMLEHANPLIKVTIVPRGNALGAAWYLPEERQITTKSQMQDLMCATLGGRAAEELFVGDISSGALNDLERVTKQAYGMIAYLGMSDRLPNLCYYNNEEYAFTKPYSDDTARTIDDEVKKLVNEQYERAKRILSEYAEGHRQLADLLIEKEVIFSEDLERIFGKRKWGSRAEEIMTDDNKAQKTDTEEEPKKEDNDKE